MLAWVSRIDESVDSVRASRLHARVGNVMTRNNERIVAGERHFPVFVDGERRIDHCLGDCRGRRS